MLDDPEGFRAVTPTNSFDSVGYDVYVPNYPSKDIIYYLEPGRQAIIDTGIVLEIPNTTRWEYHCQSIFVYCHGQKTNRLSSLAINWRSKRVSSIPRTEDPSKWW
ncbi:hypothetical protein CEXT_662191 [Caerostris extrusa]|uniref:Uncharacterized protein n=1 Tax=Caerostris extrusa TaxID=172846 RepID=A0AAV4WR45_CAEEX|nr:hypothetical protein CEXT_662191 [Caerostris extrusa]